MPPSIADVRPTTPEELEVQEILGGTCPLAPIQVCILWTARQEKVISPLAFKVYFAAHEVKYWRCKTKPNEPCDYEPYGFQPSDVGRLLPGVTAAKITRAFDELEGTNILTISNTGVWFAESLEDVKITERVKYRTQSMFAQLHQDTRDKVVKIPRRILKLIVQSGRRIVRAATLLGLLLTTMLTKRTAQYRGYQGCCKASWIARIFGVHPKRVSVERQQLIEEGWFRRLPTPQHVRNRWGEWVALTLAPSHPPAVDNPTLATTEVQPPPSKTTAQVQPPFLKPDSPSESPKNQRLTPDTPPGPLHNTQNTSPTWSNILLQDLRCAARSDALRRQAIQHGYLLDTQADRLNFFAAVAHALRVATRNVCGLLRSIVEQGLWHVITQADESTAAPRLRQADTRIAPAQARDTIHTGRRDLVEYHAEEKEEATDAQVVQVLRQDLRRAGVGGDVFATVQRHGYLMDWTRARWHRAVEAVARAERGGAVGGR